MDIFYDNHILETPPPAKHLPPMGFHLSDYTSLEGFSLDHSVPPQLPPHPINQSNTHCTDQNMNIFYDNHILETPLPAKHLPPLGFDHSDYTSLGLDHSIPPQLPSLLTNQSITHCTDQNMEIFYGHHISETPPPAKRLHLGPMGIPDLSKQKIITEQLLKAAYVIETGGDTCLAQRILARLNPQLSSPIGNPFERAAFYFKEALNKYLLNVNASHSLNPYSLAFKISAYKSFSEISPVINFANFTSNQAIFESFQGFHRFHIIDFDIGHGGQWASLMQELVLREDNAAPLSFKITVFSSPATHNQLELRFTLDNLRKFASEINISLEIQVLSLDLLSSVSWPKSSGKEAIAVNVSLAASFSNMPWVFRLVKQLCPKIIVCSERGYERTDLPLLHSLESHAALLESLDAVNANLDAMQNIERFLIKPEIEKIVEDLSCPIVRPMMTWQAMFLEMGLKPVKHSYFTECQAEYLLQKTPVSGFHVVKKHNSLFLCWQMKELVGVSAWRCRSSLRR